jgi:membrane-bound lytic murein transglycosylase MltF
MPNRSIRFDDAQLQDNFISRLQNAAVDFELTSDRAASCTESEYPKLIEAALLIRDSCFRWYLTWWDDKELAMAFWREMKAAGLPFQVEHHEDRLVFLLPKGGEDRHEEISDFVCGLGAESRD